MKKYLFSAVSVFALFAYQAKAQQATLTVKPDTNVKVMNGALLYVNGEMKVDNYTMSDRKVSNSGRVRITEKLTNENATTGANFVNELDSTGKYGQLIVEEGTTGGDNTGRITSELKFKGGFAVYPFAMPYKGITAEDVVEDLLGGTAVSNAFRGYKGVSSYRRGFDQGRVPGNVLFYWDNGKYQFTQLNKEGKIGEAGEEARYYGINTKATAGKVSLTEKTKIKGTPIKGEVVMTLEKYTTLVNRHKRKKDASTNVLDGKNTGVNEYGEAYGSYIRDFAVPMPQGWKDYFTSGDGVDASDFGLRKYNLGNPYTSNISLVKLLELPENANFKAHVKSIVQYGKQVYTTGINTYGSKVSDSYGSGSGSFSSLTKDGTGDDELKIVAPFQTFAVKMEKTMPDDINVVFNDKVKTFDGTGQDGTGAVFNSVFAKTGNKQEKINQVAIDLLDDEGGITGLRTYVVASNIYEASNKGEGTEIYNINLSDDNMGIYTLQEKEDGTVDENLADNKSYINGVNADKYVGKPIYLAIQNAKGKFTFRARLNEDLLNSKNAFYFEDKKTGKIAKIDKNFAYTFDVDGTEKDRFVLYWAATPKSEKVEEVAKQEVNTTVVFRDADTYKVRFDRGIKKADVFVYNISGQLVNTAKNVDASEDYIVPLRGNSAIYIIKVVADNGRVVTKKIIK